MADLGKISKVTLPNGDTASFKDSRLDSLKYAASDSAGGPANTVKGVAGSTNAFRHVWFSDSATETARNYDDDLKYNPSTNDIKLSAAHMRYDSATKSIMFEFD